MKLNFWRLPFKRGNGHGSVPVSPDEALAENGNGHEPEPVDSNGSAAIAFSDHEAPRINGDSHANGHALENGFTPIDHTVLNHTTKKDMDITVVQVSHTPPDEYYEEKGIPLTEKRNQYKDPEQEARDNELIRQYGLLRKSYKKSDTDYPEGLGIPGDMEAGFLLAVQDLHTGHPKVIGGFRLNEVPAGKPVPATGELKPDELGVQADKIPEARIASLYPGIDPENYVVLNADGAMFDTHAGRHVLAEAMHHLLDGMVELAKKRGYDAIAVVPSTGHGLDKHLEKFYKKYTYIPVAKEGDTEPPQAQDFALTDHGEVTRKGDKKRILTMTLNPELMKYLSPAAERLNSPVVSI